MPEVGPPEAKTKVDWTEYKTVRQYHSLGDMLDECRVYGFREGVESMVNQERGKCENGHNWLTEDPY